MNLNIIHSIVVNLAILPDIAVYLDTPPDTLPNTLVNLDTLPDIAVFLDTSPNKAV